MQLICDCGNMVLDMPCLKAGDKTANGIILKKAYGLACFVTSGPPPESPEILLEIHCIKCHRELVHVEKM